MLLAVYGLSKDQPLNKSYVAIQMVYTELRNPDLKIQDISFIKLNYIQLKSFCQAYL